MGAHATSSRPTRLTPILVLLGLTALLGFIAASDPIGIYYDDGVYTLGAQSLSQFVGYTLPYPGQPETIIKYPPLFSLLLTPFIGLAQWFGDLSSIVMTAKAFMIGLSTITLLIFGHLLQQLSQSNPKQTTFRIQPWSIPTLLAVIWLGTNLYWCEYSTHIMSEIPTLLLTCLTLLWCIRHQNHFHDPTASWNRLDTVLVLLSVSTLYLRTASLVLLLAIGLWLWLHGRRSKSIYYLAACGLAYLPWAVWTALQAPSDYPIGSYTVVPYNESYLREAARYYQRLIASSPNGLFEIIPEYLRHSLTLLQTLGKTMVPGTILLPTVFNSPLINGILGSCFLLAAGIGYAIKRTNPSVQLFMVYILFYSIMLPAWPSVDQYPRFLLLVIPVFILLYTFCAASLTSTRASFLRKSMTGLLISGIILNTAVTHWYYTRSNVGWPELWPEYQAIFEVIKTQTQPTDVLWSRYASLYTFYTGRKTISHNITKRPECLTKANLAGCPHINNLVQDIVWPVFTEESVDYVVIEPRILPQGLVDPMDHSSRDILLYGGAHLKLVGESPHRLVRLYRILPEYR